MYVMRTKLTLILREVVQGVCLYAAAPQLYEAQAPAPGLVRYGAATRTYISSSFAQAHVLTPTYVLAEVYI